MGFGHPLPSLSLTLVAALSSSSLYGGAARHQPELHRRPRERRVSGCMPQEEIRGSRGGRRLEEVCHYEFPRIAASRPPRVVLVLLH
jgi:hypothetical protein